MQQSHAQVRGLLLNGDHDAASRAATDARSKFLNSRQVLQVRTADGLLHLTVLPVLSSCSAAVCDGHRPTLPLLHDFLGG